MVCARKKGMEHNLNWEDLIIPEICPVLKIPLTMGGLKNNSHSLHRIDSSKGYTKDNVEVISWRANDLIANGTLKEFILIKEYLDAR